MAGASSCSYDIGYWSGFAAADAGDILDIRALSVCMPVNLDTHSAPTWPGDHGVAAGAIERALAHHAEIAGGITELAGKWHARR